MPELLLHQCGTIPDAWPNPEPPPHDGGVIYFGTVRTDHSSQQMEGAWQKDHR
jgi:hypothetical protein